MFGNLIIRCDLHAMIPMTYEPLKGMLVVAVGLCWWVGTCRGMISLNLHWA
jgi:hypothetical protein